MNYFWAFVIGGLFCVVGQLLIDLTKLTPARILVIYVVSGTVLTVLGLYQPLVELAGCGATVPLTGFGYSLGKGVIEGIDTKGLLGAFTGGLTNFTIACIFIGTIGYTGTFVAQYEGAHHRERIGSAVWQGVWLSLIGGMFLFSCIWIAEPLFKSFGHDPSVTAQEIDYFKILCKGFIIIMCMSFKYFNHFLIPYYYKLNFFL